MKNNRDIKIAYIQEANPADRKSSSGVPYKMYEQLIRHNYSVKWIPVRYTKIFKLYSIIIRIKQKLIGKQIHFYHTKIGASLISSTVTKYQSEINDCDLIYAPLGSSALYKLKTTKPIIYESDATWNTLIDYYFYNISKKCIFEGDYVEKNAMDKSSKLIFASNWAADSAINHYQQPSKKVCVIEYGPNMDIDLCDRIHYKSGEILDILFLGVEWERKGGEIAIQAVASLNERGIKARIHIVGIKRDDFPNQYLDLEFVDYVGFLNKNIVEEYKKLDLLMRSCHLLLLPTLAECAGIAFCEANAYGLPVFTHLTGGIGNYIKNGINGYALPLGSKGQDFADIIEKCIKNDELEKLSEGALDISQNLLNWNHWGDELNKVIHNLINE